MDRLQAMAVFVAVVDSGGFARAARRLNLSPPVVTRAVAELEARLELRLLTRNTRSVRVTEAGARYAADCRRILAEIEDAEEAALGAQQRPKGTLTLTAPVLFGHLYVTPVLVSYLRRYPDVDAACLFADRVVNIVEENIDVAVRIGVLPDSSLKAVPVGRVRLMVVGTPGYFAAHGEPARPEDLAGHSIVSTGGLAPSPEWRFAENGRPLVLRMQPRMRTTTNDSALAAVRAGLGISRLLSYQAAPYLESGELQAVLENFEPAPWPVNVLHSAGSRPAAKLRSFIELAVEMLRGHPALA